MQSVPVLMSMNIEAISITEVEGFELLKGLQPLKQQGLGLRESPQVGKRPARLYLKKYVCGATDEVSRISDSQEDSHDRDVL